MDDKGRDPFEPIGPPTEDDKARPLGEKLLWFAAFAVGGLIVVVGAAYALRALLFIE